ncbi:MAG: SEL1-like repeat protein [Oxalobacter sp.]|nr:SEL1-like repeat protein [Oxalobacter sp.]
MDTDNFFFILELPFSPLPDTATVKKAIAKKQSEWSRQLNNPYKKDKAKKYLADIERMRKSLFDRNTRNRLAIQAQEIQEEKLAEIEKNLELSYSGESLSNQDVSYLLSQYGVYQITEQDIQNLYKDILQNRNRNPNTQSPQEKAWENIELPSRFQIDNVENQLKILGKDSLYGFLNMPKHTATHRLIDILDDKEKALRESAITDQNEAGKKLCGFARDIFSSETERQKYDNYLDIKTWKDLHQPIDFNAKTNEKDVVQVDFLNRLFQQLPPGTDYEAVAKAISLYCRFRKYRLADKEIRCPQCGAGNSQAFFCKECHTPLFFIPGNKVDQPSKPTRGPVPSPKPYYPPEWDDATTPQGALAKAKRLLSNVDSSGTPSDRAAQAAACLLFAAEHGLTEAKFELGRLYFQGKGVPQNAQKAFELYSDAAWKGSAPAQYYLGLMYEKGQWIPSSYSKAFEWYDKAAKQGYAAAQCNLGCLYRNGQGVLQDYQKAVDWISKSAEQGYAEAQYQLGNIALTGLISEEIRYVWDYKEACEWYRKAAEQGHAAAQYNLGYRYKTGQGISKDKQQAFEWFFKSAANGFATAQSDLGEMCFQDSRIARYAHSAFEQNSRLAEMGNADAQYNLGWMYRYGVGIASNRTLAMLWLNRAAAQGNGLAEEMLKELRSDKKWSAEPEKINDSGTAVNIFMGALRIIFYILLGVLAIGAVRYCFFQPKKIPQKSATSTGSVPTASIRTNVPVVSVKAWPVDKTEETVHSNFLEMIS